MHFLLRNLQAAHGELYELDEAIDFTAPSSRARKGKKRTHQAAI